MFAVLGMRKSFHSRSVNRPRLIRPPLCMESLEDRTVPTTLTVGVGHQYATITDALAAARKGTTIDVYASTYTQPVVIATPGISLVAVGGAIIQPTTVTPVTLGGVDIGGAAIDIYAANVTVTGFTVNGANDTDGNLAAGIRVIDGGKATIENNFVENITTSSIDSNVGIQVGDSAVAGSAGGGTAIIAGNTVIAYAGAGVLVDGPDATALVQKNTISGRSAANGGVGEYGVQVSNGALSHVLNNRISGNTIEGYVSGGYNPSTASAGIFFYNDGDVASTAESNTTTANDDGILVEQSNATKTAAILIQGNIVQQNYGYAGIFVQASNAVEVHANIVSLNWTFNGIALNQSTAVLVTGNTIIGNFNADGIYDFEGTDDKIGKNRSEYNGNNGINIDTTVGDLMLSNITLDNAYSGVQITGGSDNAVWLDISIGNVEDGIFLTNTTGNKVVSNTLENNGGSGLDLVDAPDTSGGFNTFSGNADGTTTSDAASGKFTILTKRPPTPLM